MASTGRQPKPLSLAEVILRKGAVAAEGSVPQLKYKRVAHESRLRDFSALQGVDSEESKEAEAQEFVTSLLGPEDRMPVKSQRHGQTTYKFSKDDEALGNLIISIARGKGYEPPEQANEGMYLNWSGSVASLFAPTKSMKSDAERGEAQEEEQAACPFLTKLCDDPALQGCCNFPLDQAKIHIGSDEGACDIVLMGVGIMPDMCAVHCVAGEVQVEALPSDDGSTVRVLLNGKMLRPGEAEPMKHSDCLILGYSHAFRLCEPNPDRIKAAGSSDFLQVARSSIPKLDVATAFEEAVTVEGHALEDSGDRVSAFSFINNLSTRTNDSTVKNFLSALHHIHPLVEEANVITREVFGNADLHLEIHTLTDVLDFQNDAPEIVICCLEKPSPLSRFQQTVNTVQQCLRSPTAPTSSQDLADKRWMLGCAKHPLAHAMGLDEHMTIQGHGHLLSIFSLEDFLQRLSEIRDLYQDACEMGEGFEALRQQLASQPFQNPWSQSSFNHMKVLAEEAASIRTSPLLRWLLRTPNKAPIEKAPPPGASINTIAQSGGPISDLKRRPSVAESCTSAQSSGHIFPVDIRGQDKPTPRTNAMAGIFEVDNTPIPSLNSYLKGLITDPSSADIQLAISENGEGPESTLVHAHSIVLSRLPFFRRLIADHKAMGKFPIIVPHALSVCILRQLLVYAYTDSAKEATANLSPNMLRQLQKAASNCSMPELCKACMTKLSGQESASDGSSAKTPGGPPGNTVRRRISRANSQQQVRMAERSGSGSERGLPVLLSKKSSLSDSSQGGSLKLKQNIVREPSSKAFESGENSDTGSVGQPGAMESSSSVCTTPVDGRDGGDEIARSHVRLSSGSLRAFAEEMAELRRLLLAHPKAQGKEIPKRATELLEDLQSSMMETIRSEFRGCLKEAQEERLAPQVEPATLSSLATGITSQIHTLREDLMSMLHKESTPTVPLASQPARVASRSPIRMVGSREESPPARMGGFSTEPVARFDRQAATPPLSMVPMGSAPSLAPGAAGSAKPMQRLVIHASTSQLPGTVTRAPSPSASPCYVLPCFRSAPQTRAAQTRSVSPLPRSPFWQMSSGAGPSGQKRSGWWAAHQNPQLSVKFNNRSPRPRMNVSASGTLLPPSPWQTLQEPVALDPSKASATGPPTANPSQVSSPDMHAVETLKL
ncbi:unnamed protein product [Effrenium voratum]|uniref:BTB domain-containing protein n=1 Tax=Effrenium voratum TaxID=2562239 RepID=A0AA36JE41_9DINO|nr:unnamed protein product [Effrenium voratum]